MTIMFFYSARTKVILNFVCVCVCTLFYEIEAAKFFFSLYFKHKKKKKKKKGGKLEANR